MRYQLERFAFWIIRSLAALLPRKAVLAFGRAFGFLAFYLDRRHRDVALQNFGVAFPDVPAKQSANTVRKCYSFFGQYLLDMLTFFQCFPPERMRDFEYEGIDNLEAGYARGKGVIFFTAHWGAWELMAIAHGYKGYSLGAVVYLLRKLPFHNPLWHAMVLAAAGLHFTAMVIEFVL